MMIPAFLKRTALFCVDMVIAFLTMTSSGHPAIPLDDGPPGIILTVPVGNASEVSTTQSIVVQFSKKIDPRTLTPATFFVKGAEGSLHYHPILKSVTWVPAAPLEALKTYTATVSEGIKDLNGRPLPFAYSWTFTTRKRDEPEGLLTVQQKIPVDNAAHVSVETVISVTFNREINPETLRPGRIVLMREEPIDGQLLYNRLTHTVLFLPAIPLDYGSSYTVRVEEGIEDQAGDRLMLGVTWTFTTETPPHPVAGLFP
jgi:hypothetical protein